ncbi:DUF2235 domain-containing protein [Enterobacteriaceae bacterium BIT-l23]|uniref:T6SS phospholipase effector Tle1-like catalytic domain-containing protein n=1 Tax=Jejubacter sp. L23 TaxID=3092086 RepID=UPI001584CBB2|nr:DUF2235 domain-containing protein [Enterobacteriaceae bacterium BIT-l23]
MRKRRDYYIRRVLRMKEKRVVTLTIGLFFDGTGNNAGNLEQAIKAACGKSFNISSPNAGMILENVTRNTFKYSSLESTSYSGYYTNIYWLYCWYQVITEGASNCLQYGLYIGGPGTRSGEPDCLEGLALGCGSTGIIAKTDEAVSAVVDAISLLRLRLAPDAIVKLQFDLFGFSRGAAAARHFANRVFGREPHLISAVGHALEGVHCTGEAVGKVRFIGLFDTVAAVGSMSGGMDPHSADSGDVNLVLRPGVAERVFHLTAQHECRYNFALNSVNPGWPEMALPGVHADIGGGYWPTESEEIFLSRPVSETVLVNDSDDQTRAYRKAQDQLDALNHAPDMASLLQSHPATITVWSDARLAPDRYGQPRKRSFAAITLNGRIVHNDWSGVALRVMKEAAREAGVCFAPEHSIGLPTLPDELAPLLQKALEAALATRCGHSVVPFSQQETALIAQRYIHCSANWNAINRDNNGRIVGSMHSLEVTGFPNRPDHDWCRTIYSMDGKVLSYPQLSECIV